MRNAFSVDLEEWFCVSNFESVIDHENWSLMESRIESSTLSLLELLKKHQTLATFFVLGWVAERHPDLIRRIADDGHEIASHGYRHQLVYNLTPSEFKNDLQASLDILEPLSGQPCLGYRAPSFSIRREMTWAWDTLSELGFKYDSSIFPIVHDRYGEPDAPTYRFKIDTGCGSITEFPMSTFSFGGKNIPVAGGGYFRLYPYLITRAAIRRINKSGHFAIVYVHPWEVDPRQPKPRVSLLKLLRHRIGMQTALHRLDRLLGDFTFGPLREMID